MHFLTRFAKHVALATACLFGALAPANAQTTLIGAGAGAYVAQNQQTHLFAFTVSQRANGTVKGHILVLEPATQGLVRVDVTSWVYVGNTLAAAGTVTMSINAPAMFAVGNTAFFAVNSNTGAPDQFAGLGNVPPQFGSLTIQQIIALIGPPPPQNFAPLLFGCIRIA
jgi:hypothetical protein